MYKNIKAPKDSKLKNCIWETKNYHMFNFVEENRDIVKKHINEFNTTFYLR